MLGYKLPERFAYRLGSRQDRTAGAEVPVENLTKVRNSILIGRLPVLFEAVVVSLHFPA